jgi:hypothetical protein
MASTTPDPTLTTADPDADAPGSVGVAPEDEQYLAARLARWLADVAIASAAAPPGEELDDAA